MQELRVTFGKGEDAQDQASYRIQITDGAGAALGVARSFEPFLDERDHDDLRWYLRIPRRASAGPTHPATPQRARPAPARRRPAGPCTLGAEEQEFLAQLDGAPEPLPVFANHLRALAAGQLSPIPPDLPEALRDLLQQLHDALNQADPDGERHWRTLTTIPWTQRSGCVQAPPSGQQLRAPSAA